MTAQLAEKLIYNGKPAWMAAKPLNPYLEAHNIQLTPESTACYRGYFGIWEIKDDKLYLNDLKVFFKSYFNYAISAGMDRIFPGQQEVFAEWYTGPIRIPSGECLEYVHYAYSSIYEQHTILQLEKGMVICTEVRDNTIGFVKKKKYGGMRMN